MVPETGAIRKFSCHAGLYRVCNVFEVQKFVGLNIISCIFVLKNINIGMMICAKGSA